MALIEVRDLTVGWGEAPLIEHVDFDVERGDVFLVLGGSGSGKSTLLRHLVGLLPPMAGTVRVEGVSDEDDEEQPPPFGVLFQSGALFGSMTLAQNVALPLEKWTELDEGTIDLVVRSKLALVGLDGYEHHLPAELSGGMRKRAGIARALVLEPELLFLDEPSAGLDPVTSAGLDELILSLNEVLGRTIVIVTHELASILAVGKSCILLDKESRSVVASGAPRELHDRSDDPRVRRFFHREAGTGARA